MTLVRVDVELKWARQDRTCADPPGGPARLYWPPAGDHPPCDHDDCDDQQDPGDSAQRIDNATYAKKREQQQDDTDDENCVHGPLRVRWEKNETNLPQGDCNLCA